MESTKYLIIGGGLAAATAAEELVRADESARGATVILTAEAELPYHRPPLSKGFLTGSEKREDLFVHPEDFYSSNGIEVRFRTRARLIDPASRVCELELNRSIGFERALIVTGASPVRFEGPGRALEGVHYLRNMQDAERIRRASDEWNEVAILGAGFIGMELAAAFAARGIRTTVISRGRTVLDRMHNPEVSAFLQRYFERRGVRFLLEDEPYGLLGSGEVNLIHTRAGQKVACDGVVFGVGATPNVDLALASRLRVENGVVVDGCLQTAVPGIYAAGDVANFPDAVFGVRRRVEHWDNAESQGRVAGRNLAGGGERFDRVSMYFTDLFDLSLEVWGMPREGDRIVLRGDLTDRSIFAWHLRDDVVNAAVLMGRPPEESELVEKIIRARLNVAGRIAHLRDPRKPLEDLL